MSPFRVPDAIAFGLSMQVLQIAGLQGKFIDRIGGEGLALALDRSASLW